MPGPQWAQHSRRRWYSRGTFPSRQLFHHVAGTTLNFWLPLRFRDGAVVLGFVFDGSVALGCFAFLDGAAVAAAVLVATLRS